MCKGPALRGRACESSEAGAWKIGAYSQTRQGLRGHIKEILKRDYLEYYFTLTNTATILTSGK